MPEPLAEWVQRQVRALIELGDSPLDAQMAVERALRGLSEGQDPETVVEPTDAGIHAIITQADMLDARADWYASEDVPAGLKRLLDAQVVQTPFRESVTSLAEEAPPRSLLQGYVWDSNVGRYRYRDGRFVARTRITTLMNRSVQGREERILAGTRALADGSISQRTYVQRTEMLLKRQYLQNAALGMGGWDRLTPEVLDKLSAQLNSEFSRMIAMSQELKAKEISEAQALNRTHMYLGNARAQFYDYEREGLGPLEAGMVYMERRRLGHADHCHDCIGYSMQGWQPLGVLPVPGYASQCIPGDQLVTASGVQQIYRRVYSGWIIKVTTSLGHQFAATPNHPIATMSGWVAVGALHEGDKVVYDTRLQGVTGRDPDVEDVPAPISELYDALTLSGGRERVIGSRMDFHGDGGEEQVDIVRADHALAYGMKPLSFEEGRDLFLSLPNACVRDAGLMPSGEFGLHMQRHSSIVTSDRNVTEFQKAFDGQLGATVLVGESAQRHALLVCEADGLGRELPQTPVIPADLLQPILSKPSGFDARIMEHSADQASAVSVCLGKRQDGLAFPITLDDCCNDVLRNDDASPALPFALDGVVSLERVWFDGHVYNLTTSFHYYTTGGVVVKNCDGNCRCELERKPVTQEEATQMLVDYLTQGALF